jgi:thiol-disulfide isomerase/thioredoxin
MSKKALSLIVAIVLSIGGGVTYLLVDTPDNTAEKMSIGSENQTELINPAATAGEPGSYIDYGPTVIANTAGVKLLFFHAPWCPQCRDLEADIKDNDIPTGVTIIKVDYDTNQSLRQKYGVTVQTTVVLIDDEGNLVRKFVAYDDPSLKSIKENLL